MCYDYTTSRNAFIIGMISSLLLFFSSGRNSLSSSSMINYPSYTPKILGLMCMFVALMQYYDSVFWTNKPSGSEEASEKNARFTKIAAITNNIQPLVLGLIIYYYKGGLSDFSKKLLFVYLIATIIYTYNGWNRLKYTQVTSESTCEDGKESLYWEWNKFDGASYYYGLYLIVINYLLIKEIGGNIGKIAALAIMLTFIYSLWKYNKILSLGRFWCYFAALIPIIFILILS